MSFAIIAGCSHSGTWRYPSVSADDVRTVHIVNHGWHTGVVIAADQLDPELSFLRPFFEDQPWFEFGWGDRDFYTAKSQNLAMTLRAAFWPTPTVVHVVALPKDPKTWFSNSEVVTLSLSSEAHQKLNAAISESFSRSDSGSVVAGGKGLYGRSLFFDGFGSYVVTNTCNTWTARVLKQAGVPVRTFLAVSARDVMAQAARAAAKRPDF